MSEPESDQDAALDRDRLAPRVARYLEALKREGLKGADAAYLAGQYQGQVYDELHADPGGPDWLEGVPDPDDGDGDE